MTNQDKKTKSQLESEVSNLTETMQDQSEQIKQMQETIRTLQSQIELNNKTNEVRRNLSAEKEKERAINPQNIHKKLKVSGHSPDIQEQIMKNIN